MQSAQERFDHYVNNGSRKPYNKRIGDFLYIHREADPSWILFFDRNGNTVMYGGRGCYTDVIVRIGSESLDVLKPKLIAYMQELLARHGEELHDEGEKLFSAVTIRLPYERVHGFKYEVTIHTGSGCFYDQEEIGYEVIAALSGIPVYKALAPIDSYYDFQRIDTPGDEKWVTFWHQRQGFKVTFSHFNDKSFVVISKGIHEPRVDWEKFKTIMYDFLSEIVKGRTGQEMVRRYGEHHYQGEDPRDSVSFHVESGSLLDFAVVIPYRGGIHSFPRLAFAKEAMEILSKKFRVEKEITD